MALFDQFGPAQANNGQAPPSPQATSGAPGFPFGSWGNQPPNMAGGLQQFLAARGMAQPMPGMAQTNGPMPPSASAQSGMFGAPTLASQPPLAGMPQSGNPMQQQPVPGQPAPMMGQASGAMPPNMAGAMQPFLGARR